MSWESEELNARNGFYFSGNWEPFSQQSSGAIPGPESLDLAVTGYLLYAGTKIEQ